MKIFISYTKKDRESYRISEIVEQLEQHSKFENIFYYERDAKKGFSFDDYMIVNIEKSDVCLLICSENSSTAQGVFQELGMIKMANRKRENKNKIRIIPVFRNLDDVVSTMGRKDINGVIFSDEFEVFIDNLYFALTGEKLITKDKIEKGSELNSKEKNILGYFLNMEEIFDDFYYKYYYTRSNGNPNNWDSINKVHFNLILHLGLENEIEIKEIINNLSEKSIFEQFDNNKIVVNGEIKEKCGTLKQEVFQKISKIIKEISENYEKIISIYLYCMNLPMILKKKITKIQFDSLVELGFLEEEHSDNYNLAPEFSSKRVIFNKNNNEVNYIEKKLEIQEENIKKEIQTRIKELTKSFSDDDKLFLSIISSGETVILRRWDSGGGRTKGTIRKYERNYESIEENYRQKLEIISMISGKDITYFEKIKENLEKIGIIWEENVTVYSVITKDVLKSSVSNEDLAFDLDKLIKIDSVLEYLFQDSTYESIQFVDYILDFIENNPDSWQIDNSYSKCVLELLKSKIPKRVKYLYQLSENGIIINPYALIKAKPVIDNYKLKFTVDFWDSFKKGLEPYKNNPNFLVNEALLNNNRDILLDLVKKTIKIIIMPWLNPSELESLKNYVKKHDFIVIFLTNQNLPSFSRVLSLSLEENEEKKIITLLVKNKEIFLPSNVIIPEYVKEHILKNLKNLNYNFKNDS